MQSAQSNWTSSVSQYLTTRRKQTRLAYRQTDMKIAKSVDDNLSNQFHQIFCNYEACLFEVMLSALGMELEQGNTVINLTAELWQRQLMTTFLSQCSSLLDMPVSTMVDTIINDIDSDIDGDINNMVLSIQDNATQENIKHQLSLAKHFQQFFLEFNQQPIELPYTRLACFFEGLSRLPFFVSQQLLINSSINHQNTSNNSNSYNYNYNFNSNQHAPIVLKHQNKRLSMWIHRSWLAEQSVLQHINRLSHWKPNPLDLSGIISSSQDNPKGLNDEQIHAVTVANESAFSIITGGPGTGKTYTVAQLVIAIEHGNDLAVKNGDIPLSLVLAAPTGKAAQRMQESLQSAIDDAKASMNLPEAKTIHRLLGIGQTGIPRYGVKMPLSEDVIIIDEASMLGVELANYLLSAVKTGARLILLGDAHQLSAVEAGAVLSDLCNLQTIHVSHANLIESRRYTDDSAVGQLANIINQPFGTGEVGFDASSIFDKIKDKDKDKDKEHDAFYNSLMTKMTDLIDNFDDLNLYNVSQKNYESYNTNLNKNQQGILPNDVYQTLIKSYHGYFLQTKLLNNKTVLLDVEQLGKLMNVFNEFRILSTGHNGSYGDEQINKILTQAHRQFLQLPISQLEWFHGRPVMVRQNNYSLGLFNGDIGLCVDTTKGLAVFFEGKKAPTPINSLGDLVVTTAYAMTVHKSQGSEFEHVAIMLDERIPRLLNREMLYTAVTRSKKQVSLFASNNSIYTAVTSPTVRYTGLSQS